jgi:hypothetical protein
MAREPDNQPMPATSWARCPSGEMQRLGVRLRERRQRRLFLRATAAGVAAIGSGGLLWFFWPAGNTRPGGLACAEVEQLVDAYAKGTLDQATRSKVRQHVAVCPRCGPRFRARGLPT